MRLEAYAGTLPPSLFLSLSFVAFPLYEDHIGERIQIYRVLTRGMISRARLRSVVRRECNLSPSQDSRDTPTSLSRLVCKTSGHELTTPLKREVLGTRCPRFTFTPLVVAAARYRKAISRRCWELARYYERMVLGR